MKIDLAVLELTQRDECGEANKYSFNDSHGSQLTGLE